MPHYFQDTFKVVELYRDLSQKAVQKPYDMPAIMKTFDGKIIFSPSDPNDQYG